jgi:hypothetical protein
MDEIFHNTTNVFNVVKIAKELPHRYDKNGELLVRYEETEEYKDVQRRRSSVTGAPVPVGKKDMELGAGHQEHVDVDSQKSEK